jgi:hypothetical protein
VLWVLDAVGAWWCVFECLMLRGMLPPVVLELSLVSHMWPWPGLSTPFSAEHPVHFHSNQWEMGMASMGAADDKQLCECS